MVDKVEKWWLDRVAQTNCALCGNGPVEVHHAREHAGMAQRGSHFNAAGLCAVCHRGPLGIHGNQSLLRVKKMHEYDLVDNTIRQVAEQIMEELG